MIFTNLLWQSRISIAIVHRTNINEQFDRRNKVHHSHNFINIKQAEEYILSVNEFLQMIYKEETSYLIRNYIFIQYLMEDIPFVHKYTEIKYPK